ncbi:hypothetical protein K8353_01400 [Burkholderia contaminans]|nr:hypothetical protein [Burkholderia contaminans]
MCKTDLEDKKLTPLCQSLNPPWHCEDLTTAGGAYHKFCEDSNILYQPIPMLACYNPNTTVAQYFPPNEIFQKCGALGPPWEGLTCYCCCSCFANDTKIAVPGGTKEIYLIAKGDEVLTASVASGGKIEWSSATVSFSAGTALNGHQPMMIYLSLSGTATHDLICNLDQPFLLANGKYAKASKLRPGDQLVDKDGNPVQIDMISIGSYDGGVHHISTDAPWNRHPDGHLLLAGGVVAGDYTMQLYFDQLPDTARDASTESLPMIGTAEYETAHATKIVRSDVFFEFVSAGGQLKNAGQHKLSSGLFKTYRVSVADVPYGAQALLTPAQAADIAQNGKQTPLSNPIPRSIFNTVTAQLAGFFPDIVFYYDTLEAQPNVYAIEAYGKKIVSVTGGFARNTEIGYEALMMAIAHGIACFRGGPPLNSFGYSAVGQADWFAYGVISRLTWVGQPYVTYITNAINQWTALFALVSPENAQGNANDRLNDPSLACRIQAIQSAAGGGSLPECAGGAPLPKIALQKATATSDDDVVVNLSLAVDQESGSIPANYVLTPAATVTRATPDATTGLVVRLKADLEPHTQYRLTVKNLVSILGSGVDPQQDSVQVKTNP